MEASFEVLRTSVEAPPPRERRENQWISLATWQLVDDRARQRKLGLLTKQSLRVHNRKVQAGLKQDRRKRASDAGARIEQKLGEGDLKEAWRGLKGWYSAVEERAPKPCYLSMQKQTNERVALYGKVDPPGEPIPINIDPFTINDAIPTEPEIRSVVKGLRNGRAGGVSGIKAEHMKQWLHDAVGSFQS